MDEVHVERLIQQYKDSGELDGEDPALLMLKQWPASKQFKDNPEKLPGLEQQINRHLEILLESELNSDKRYGKFRDTVDKTKKTLMHYAAEHGFLHVTKTLARKLPLLLSMTTEDVQKPVKKRAMLPVELAIASENDDVAAFLVRVMWHGRVQSLFSWTPGKMTNPKPSLLSFKGITENPKLKKTVVAVLDQMINPHWPYLPQRQENYETEEEREAIEGVWKTITDDPLNYHFYFHILDGDKDGQPPKIMTLDGYWQIDNKYFNWRDSSCLHTIAKSNNKEALQHPVVRMLIKTKWKRYGHLFLSLQAALYVIFLLCLSYSLLHASTKLDPTHYSGALDLLRGFCEIVTLLMVVFYTCEEIYQIRIEGRSYFTQWMTLFDWLGQLFILCIIPLRYMDLKAQWMVTSLAFLFNFMRIFKFSCLSRTTGLYTQTLAKIILHDVTRSMAVFVVIFFSFCGALTLSLCYSGSSENQELRGFGDVLLSGFQALSDQYPMVEDYSTFNWLSVLLMMAYMGTVTVILLNILIAQMSTTYTQAKQVARLEYDVDRILQLTRMERFPFLNLRVKYYKEGDWISEMNLAKELLEFSEDRNPWESVEEKLCAIREKMRKMVKQMRPAQY
ncbi:transient receptor potential cation channel subfamily V member 5-like [Stylophora pistillata]|uniref:transient receptor potential cation channel subfamily V member 5-like n=1 Tax=Stylophora pistillata TaxID=50429 RepID=UPI000C04BDF0|nr:transient receptor potential cation channel subfamily V member 5-like [Stylophora pistillata]